MGLGQGEGLMTSGQEHGVALIAGAPCPAHNFVVHVPCEAELQCGKQLIQIDSTLHIRQPCAAEMDLRGHGAIEGPGNVKSRNSF